MTIEWTNANNRTKPATDKQLTFALSLISEIDVVATEHVTEDDAAKLDRLQSLTADDLLDLSRQVISLIIDSIKSRDYILAEQLTRCTGPQTKFYTGHRARKFAADTLGEEAAPKFAMWIPTWLASK